MEPSIAKNDAQEKLIAKYIQKSLNIVENEKADEKLQKLHDFLELDKNEENAPVQLNTFEVEKEQDYELMLAVFPVVAVVFGVFCCVMRKNFLNLAEKQKMKKDIYEGLLN